MTTSLLLEARCSRRQVCRGLLGGTAALLLSGCKRTSTPSAAEDAQSDAECVTLQMPGSSSAEACARLSRRLSTLTQERYGFTLELRQLPEASYETTLWQQMKSGNTADLFFLPDSISLSGCIYENCVFPLSAMMQAHPALRAAFPEQLWKNREYNRVLYAIPARETDCYQLAFLARTDLLEALDADPAAVTDLDSLHGLLTKARQTWPDLTPVVPHCGSTLPCLEQDPLNDNLGVLLNNSGSTVTNWYTSEEYRALCLRMYRWAQEGLILQEGCLRTATAAEMLEVCGGLGYFTRLGADQTLPAELTALPAGPVLQNSSGYADSWALPVRQSPKRQALQLLELLYTDETAARLFAFGESGVDDLPGGSGLWRNRCVSIACLHPGTALVPQQSVRTSPAYGFVFNESSCLAQVSVCSALQQQYHNALMCGWINPEEALPLFRKDLEEAGIQEILAVKQRRLNDWLRVQRA